MTEQERPPFVQPPWARDALAEGARRRAASARGERPTYPDLGSYVAPDTDTLTRGERAWRAIQVGALVSVLGLVVGWVLDVSTQTQGQGGFITNLIGPSNAASSDFFWTRLIPGDFLAIGGPVSLLVYAASGRRRKNRS